MKEEVIDELSRKIPNPEVEIPFSEEERVNPGVSGPLQEIRDEAKLGDKRVYQCAYGIIVY